MSLESDRYSGQHKELKRWEAFEAVTDENAPVVYYQNAQTKEKAVGILDVMRPISETDFGPLAEPYLRSWAGDLENQILLDKQTLLNVVALHRRSGSREKFVTHLEGPPASSKSIVARVYGAMMEKPVVRFNFDTRTRIEDMFGGFVPGTESHMAVQLSDVLEIADDLENPKAIKRVTEELIQMQVAGEKITSTKSGKSKIRILESLTGIAITEHNELEWVDSPSLWAYEYGWLLLWDEPNIMENADSQMDAANEFLELNGDFSIPMHGAPEKLRKMHPDFEMFMATNSLAEMGRQPFSGPVMSRLNKVTVPGITKDKIEGLYRFMLTGKNPDISINGATYRGTSNIDTPYRVLEPLIPHKDLVIETLSKLHMDLVEKAEENRISGRDHAAGQHWYDLRDVVSFLNFLRDAVVEGSVVKRKGKTVEQVTDPSELIQDAFARAYTDGMDIEQQKVMEDVIENHPLFITLSETEMPDWAPTIKGAKRRTDRDGSSVRYK